MLMRFVLIASLMFVANFSYGGDYVYSEFLVSVPDTFDRPIVRAAQGGKVWGFAKQRPDTETAGLFQITIYDFGETFPEISPNEIEDAMDQYLLEFLSGVERRRTNFSIGAIFNSKIGDRPSRAIDWKGTVGGKETQGRMFVTIVGSSVVSLHIQDVAQYFADTMAELSDSLLIMQLNGI